MAYSLSRSLYRCLLRLHPPSFQVQFADEMMWIFDETAERQGALKLLGDALFSLVRQWIVRYALQKWLTGDFAPAAWPSLTHELFAWERIALPERHLSLPRMAQGSLICFLLVLTPLTMLYGESARSIRGISTTRRHFARSQRFTGSGFQSASTVSGVSAERNRGMGSAVGDGGQSGLSEGDGSLQITSPRSNAFDGILEAFKRYNIVALDEPHGDQVASDFRIELIHQPALAEKVDEIAFESGNSLYQEVLDRYISGEEVPHEEIAAVWRNTTQVGCCDSGLIEQFFSEVRKVNQTLPRAKRIRVLALDPPIDWNKVHSAADWAAFMDRDSFAASLIEREVFQRKRKVLIIMGGMHLYRNKHDSYPWLTTLIEKKHPGAVFVITTIRGGPGPYGATESAYAELQKKLGTSKVPFFALLKGTPAGSLDANPFFQFSSFRKIDGKLTNVTGKLFPGLKLEDLADACLILGPEKLAQVDPEIYKGTAYGKELDRRRRILSEGQAGMAPAPPPPNPPQT